MPNMMAQKKGEAVFQARRDRLRRMVGEKRLDALLVSHAPNRFYLSGFELHDPQPNESAGMLVICADGSDWLATDARYAEAAARLWNSSRIFIYGGDRAADMRKLLGSLGSRIGVETAAMSVKFFRELTDDGKGFRPLFEQADGLVESLRVVKDGMEIDALEASFRLNHKMLDWLEKEQLVQRAPEASEKELAWEIEKFFRENGAQELAFASIVAKGPNAALPHALPGDEKAVSDCPLLVDVGCRVDNYCSDQTRTFWLGSQPSKEYVKTLKLVKDAQNAALDIMRPGISCASVYKAARDVFVKAGVEKAFNHGLGHGVGLETHEAPSLSPRSRATLEPGMVVTVEPGLYYPDWGGVRWEYTVLVKESGVTVL